jgi:hypothetical protein
MRCFLGFAGAAILSALLSGCSAPTHGTVTGNVSIDGEPVGDGMITFLPADGKGPVAGGPIRGGKFTVTQIAPGPKIVKVEAVKAVPFARSSEEMERRAAENRDRGDGSGIIDRADAIPENAQGNNAAFDVRAGTQAFDVELRSRPS